MSRWRFALLGLPILLAASVVLWIVVTPKSKEVLLQTARTAMTQARHASGEQRSEWLQTAIRNYRELIERYGSADISIEARKELADALELEGNLGEAADWYREYARVCQNQNLAGEALWKAINLYESLGRDDRLGETYPTFFEQHPASGHMPKARYQYLMYQRRHPDRFSVDLVLRESEKLAADYEMFENRPDLLLMIGDLHAQQGRPDVAIRWYDRLIEDHWAVKHTLPALGRKMALARKGAVGMDAMKNSIQAVVRNASQVILDGARILLIRRRPPTPFDK